MTLVIGRRYLCGLAPFGLTTVVYLGRVPGMSSHCRVRIPFEGGRVVHVNTEGLRPLLVDVAERKP